MKKSRRLLIIDDEENMRHMLASVMTRAGYQVSSATDGSQGLAALEKKRFDCVLCDLKMPKMNGLQFIHALRSKGDETTVIMMSAYATVDTAVEAMKCGAFDFITKPFKNDEILMVLKRAEERDQLLNENRELKKRVQLDQGGLFGGVVGNSQPIRKVIDTAKKVAHYDTTVLITGQSGTGKELIAQGIHQHSRRSKAPLVSINCGSIPENLLESEFFGYKKGAFTGADTDKKGLFEQAEGGTLFLDEIGELPSGLQVKLLRALQEREIRPIGDRRPRRFDVRIIAATGRDLLLESEQGRFRQDLLYRLNVVTIELPPLNARIEDIPILCKHFLNKCSKRMGSDIKSISSSALSALMEHDWPGNVRELENVIERATIFADKETILPEDLPQAFGAIPRDRRLDDILGTLSLKKGRGILEKRLINRVLAVTRGNKSRAAEILEISYPSLLAKIKEHGCLVK